MTDLESQVAPYARAVSVVLSPQQSVLALLRQATAGQAACAPAGLLADVRAALRPQARFAAQSFTRPSDERDRQRAGDRGGADACAQLLGTPDCPPRWLPCWTPESCTPISPLADVSVADQAARMRDLPAAALTGELQAAEASPDCPPRWRAAADQPRRWLNSMADASLDTWAVAEPRWRAAGPLLDREIRRAGTAMVRGGMAALLNSLHPRISYHDGTFAFAACHDEGVMLGTVGPRRLVLVPMIAGPGALLVSFERPDVCYIGYPLPQPTQGTRATADSTLTTILGPVRAAILRALRQPLTVSQLAAAAHCAPTTATYHLHQLSAAGLITRQKSGPTTHVCRTTRGDELVDLLTD